VAEAVPEFPSDALDGRAVLRRQGGRPTRQPHDLRDLGLGFEPRVGDHIRVLQEKADAGRRVVHQAAPERLHGDETDVVLPAGGQDLVPFLLLDEVERVLQHLDGRVADDGQRRLPGVGGGAYMAHTPLGLQAHEVIDGAVVLHPPPLLRAGHQVELVKVDAGNAQSLEGQFDPLLQFLGRPAVGLGEDPDPGAVAGPDGLADRALGGGVGVGRVEPVDAQLHGAADDPYRSLAAQPLDGNPPEAYPAHDEPAPAQTYRLHAPSPWPGSDGPS
jgi:hypothetical protein